ncbi:MAG TPA: CotH kinase family protein [Tepidisphaeraceae bacterium]|jgi:hypothetical protein
MRSSRSDILAVSVLLVLLPVVGRSQAAPPPKRAAQTTATATTKAAEELPWCTRVSHAPQQPKSGETVKITVSIREGMTDVSLEYQVLEAGAYVELKDPEYARNWTPIAMKAGATADGRTTFSVELPAALQKHRRLIRYRITAKDPSKGPVLSPMFPATAATPTAPATPESPSNYAYFVYDGLPAWRGAINPNGRGLQRAQVTTFPPEMLGRVQPYHLIGRKDSIENATWREQAGGKEFKYTGALVVDGVVHDHVKFRARGGVWRYAMGKNMWKIDLPPGDRIKAKDDYGRPYPVPWTKINLRSLIQLGSYGHRGEQGMFESVGFRLFNLVGVPAPATHWVQLRIIDEADESPADQYRGDFWGLYLAIENEDGRFLRSHDLPDGNLYKMMGGTGELNHNGAGQPTDRSDLDKFLSAYNTADQSEDWWRAHLDLPTYYSYRSIIECIHHYDVDQGAGKNYDYFLNPNSGKWTVIPWDLDLTWADNMYGNGDEPFRSRVLAKPAFNLDYQNRLREIRDLLFNPEQADQLIDECAAVVCDPKAKGTSIVEADRRKWDFHPALGTGGQGGHGQYYIASATRDFSGMTQLMKNYVRLRGQWVDMTLLRDPRIPATPTLTYSGPADHPANRLAFRPSRYQGRAPFAAAKWRIAEVTPTGTPINSPPKPRLYEISPTWESDELPKLEQTTIPDKSVKPGHAYRVRVRVKDETGRWSHWSAPVEFVAGNAG